MRRQIFRQMKQKAEWILDVFTSIFVKYESLFRIWRMQIASSDFLRDEGKNGENPLWIFEYFPEISRKICTQDACGKIRNRLWREICKQMACKVARRSLCGIALGIFPDMPAYTVHEVIFVAFSNLQTLLRQSSSSRQFLLSLPVGIQLRLHERSQFIHTQQELRRHAAFLQQVQRLYSVLP